MEIIKLQNNSVEVVGQALQVLRKGGVIAYPTETAYGLGADFFNLKALKKIYQIKGRKYGKPLSVIVSDLAMAKRLVRFDKIALKLAKKHWPGALTLVLPLKENISGLNKATAGLAKQKNLALRISSDKLATFAVKTLGRPLTATSANISGAQECYSAKEVVAQFAKRKSKPDLIIDAGQLEKQKPSTIVRIIGSKVEVLRQGNIKVK